VVIPLFPNASPATSISQVVPNVNLIVIPSCIKCLSAGAQSQNFGCNRCKGDDKCDNGGCVVGLYFNNE